ncbi:MAG: glycosyltransferase family 2 protein [Chlamydiia bacterium]|nr:glycosyltransferase family 2 protein [Chlamydiia bacterium]
MQLSTVETAKLQQIKPCEWDRIPKCSVQSNTNPSNCFGISVTILVKNGEKHLRSVLKALSSFDEVVVADTGSTDNTESIAKSFGNVTFATLPFEGFGKTHNQASGLAKHDWILSIDSDEEVSKELVDEIHHLQLDTKMVYSFPFINYFNGKEIKWCGWQNETHVRLYHRQSTRFSETLVHEGIITHGLEIVHLKHPVHHTSYDSISDFLIKMERYSTLFSIQYQGKKVSSPLKAFYHGLGAFLKSYFLKKGFLGGYEGYLISVYNGQTAFYKYLKLYHINQSC